MFADTTGGYVLPLPNYPPKEPVFYVPNVPELTRVPEPRPAKRPPAPGYDMRTLRKQVEFLQTEIEERIETQNLLYRQNEELWTYTQNLLDTNKSNVNLMRDQVQKLHDELRQLHTERGELAQKLSIAQNSKSLLQKIDDEIRSLKLAGTDAVRMRQEAEESLRRAQEERDRLDRELQDNTEKLRMTHGNLDEYRLQRRDDEAMEIADKFFVTNEAVLRSAYSRFRNGVRARLRCSRLRQVCEHIHSQQLYTKVWLSWSKFIIRRRFMHRSDARRGREMRHLCFARWKVYTMLERLFSAARARALKKKIFAAWRVVTREAQWDEEAEDKVDYFQDRQRQRRHFIAWKSVVVFLDWYHPSLYAKEVKAERHFKRCLLHAWAAVANAVRARVYDAAVQVLTMSLEKPFLAWRSHCQSLWRRRAQLLRRFFKQARRLVLMRSARRGAKTHAMNLWIGIKKKLYLSKWLRYTRSRQHLGIHRRHRIARMAMAAMTPGTGAGGGAGTGASSSLSARFGPSGISASASDFTARSGGRVSRGRNYGSSSESWIYASGGSGGGVSVPPSQGHRRYSKDASELDKEIGYGLSRGLIAARHRRLIKGALMLLTYRTVSWKRQRLRVVWAEAEAARSKALDCLCRWRTNVVADKRLRLRSNKKLLRKIFIAWRLFVPVNKREKFIERKVEMMFKSAVTKIKALLFGRWARFSKRARSCVKAHESVSARRTHALVRRKFAAWRGKWISALFWQHQHLQVEAHRVRSLHDLKIKEMEDLMREQERVQKSVHELEDALVGLQEILGDKEMELKTTRQAIKEKQRAQEEAQRALAQRQQQLVEVQAERDRLRALEQLIEEEKRREKEIMDQRKAEADQILRSLKAESIELKDELATARAQSFMVEKSASESIAREQQLLEETLQAAHAMEAIARQKALAVQQLDDETKEMQQQLKQIETRLESVQDEGRTLIGEGEARLRAKASSVRVLRSNTGLAEARVVELRDLVQEQREQLSRALLENTRIGEDREIQELAVVDAMVRQRGTSTSTSPALGAWAATDSARSKYERDDDSDRELSRLSSNLPGTPLDVSLSLGSSPLLPAAAHSDFGDTRDILRASITSTSSQSSTSVSLSPHSYPSSRMSYSSLLNDRAVEGMGVVETIGDRATSRPSSDSPSRRQSRSRGLSEDHLRLQRDEVGRSSSGYRHSYDAGLGDPITIARSDSMKSEPVLSEAGPSMRSRSPSLGSRVDSSSLGGRVDSSYLDSMHHYAPYNTSLGSLRSSEGTRESRAGQLSARQSPVPSLIIAGPAVGGADTGIISRSSSGSNTSHRAPFTVPGQRRRPAAASSSSDSQSSTDAGRGRRDERVPPMQQRERRLSTSTSSAWQQLDSPALTVAAGNVPSSSDSDAVQHRHASSSPYLRSRDGSSSEGDDDDDNDER